MSKIHKKLCWLFAVAALGASVSLHAQNFKRLYDIPVQSGNGTLKFPWVGGLNAPQINTMDLNNDGIEDIVLFERFANKVYTFIVTPGGYQYEPKYEHLFPSNLSSWLLLRDFNRDGKKDIFTGHPFGIAVFVNATKSVDQGFTWRPFNEGQPLMTEGVSGPINLKVNLGDVPSIDDIDGDGDLDILDPLFSGNNTIELHQNQSMQLNQSCDTIQLVRTTSRWGDLEDCYCGKFKFNGESCFGGGRSQHSGAKAIITYDFDHDGDHDLFYSDEFCPTITLLKNEGSIDQPIFQSYEPFMDLSAPLFLTPFFEDVDADRIKDIIITSNFSSRSNYQTDFASSVWRYKGLASGDFTFSQYNFLQEDMIDVGDDAVPAFADEDGDGDLDLFIGTFLGTNQRGSILLFRNTGSLNTPEFELVDSDYGQISKANMVSIKPAFTDINQDGRKDLVFTATDYNAGQPGLYYIENKSLTSIDLNGSIKSIPFDLQWDDRVTFTDFNSDGAPDIIEGTFFGSLQLWLNQGSNQYVLSDKLDYLGSGLDRTNPYPGIADVNFDGKDDLVIGGPNGYLRLVSDYKSGKSTPEEIPILNLISGKYEPMKLGGRLFPAIVQLYQTTIPQIVVGTSSGGLIFLYPENEEPIPPYFDIQLYPNPVSNSDMLHLLTKANGTLEVLNAVGQVIVPTMVVVARETYNVDISGLPKGVYLGRFTFSDRVFVKRLVVY